MRIEVERVVRLRFGDGTPVRAASAIAPFGDGWLIAQDDATHAGWLRGDEVTRVRALPAVEGLEQFEEASGTKHLKPDFETAVAVTAQGATGVLMLGSGSSPARMRSSLLSLEHGEPRAVGADLSPLYARAAEVLGVPLDLLNLEGACVVGDRMRWFHRGMPAAGHPTASVDLDLAGLLAAAAAGADPADIGVADLRTFALGGIHGVGLGVTDAVSLGDARVLVSAAAEDTPDPRDDGPVVGSALALLDGAEPRDFALLPEVDGQVPKVEGLTVRERWATGARLFAVVDSDDAESASLLLGLRVDW